MKITKSILLLSVFTLSLSSCKLNSAEDPTPSGTGTTSGTSSGNGTDSLTPLENIEVIGTDYTYDANTPNIIKLNGNSITVSGSGTKVSGSTVTISLAGTYAISGNLTNGQIKVQTDSSEPVKLILNGIDITNSSTSPIFIDKAKKVIMLLAKGTTNKITDGVTYTETTEGQNAAIYTQSYLAISGEGSLQVNGNFEDGIGGKDGLVINGGNITVNAKDEGIRGKDYLVIHDGSLNVSTTSGDGLKSDYEGNSKFGYVLIDKGTFKVTSQGDGISAETTLTVKSGTFDITSGGGSSKTVSTAASAKAFKAGAKLSIAVTNATISSADDGINSNTEVVVGGGTFNISSADDGIHANSTVTIQDGNITITKAFEGIEAKTITFEKGNFNIISTNDAVNATAGTDAQQDDGSFIYIKGGTFVLDAQNGDPLDSNGKISMTDGTVIIHGPAGMEVPIDYNGTFIVTKGTIIATGGSGNSRMFQAPSTNSTVNSLKLMFATTNTANTLFTVTDENGNVLVTFKPTKTYGAVIFTSEKLVKDKKYNIYTGGSITGNNTGGYYTSGNYSGGTLRGSFTVSSSVNSVNL